MAVRGEMLVDLASEHGPCSVRHLFYRAVVASVPGITKDKQGYDKVQRQLLGLRRSGAIPYAAITDTTRWQRKPDSYLSIAEALNETARLYRRNLWASSPWRLEVWAESDSISSTILPVTDRFDVPLMTTRGQSSETFAYAAADHWKRIDAYPAVLYVGDHDPAGLDIEESLRSKLEGFYGDAVQWHRVAVTWEQVIELDLPGTPPKIKGRRKPYPYDLAVEAEALPPRLLLDQIDEAISLYVDDHELRVLETVEAEERTALLRLARREVA